jgi:hypothetical protein
MPEAVSDQYSLEVTGRVGDTLIHEGIGRRETKCEPVRVLAFRPSDWMS